MEQLDGKVAVITGGASGIGLALAGKLAAQGMKLVLADIEKAALDDAVEQLSAHSEVLGVTCDVSSYGDVEAVGRAAMKRFGALHLAVNNAGVAGGGLSWEIELDQWKWILGVDLWGVIHGVKAFTPLIIESGGGHVVNTASMAGLTSTPFMSPYNVSKHGVVTLSETMYHELALLHPEVGVTVICPGWVRTRINESDRNRPGGPQGDVEAPIEPALVAAGLDGMRGAIDDLIANGLDPDDVAAQVVEAIRTRRLYVLTHREWSSAVTRRAEAMVAGDNPQLTIPGNDAP